MIPRRRPARVDGVVAGTMLYTASAGLVSASRLSRMRAPERVAVYDHIQSRIEFRELLAWRENRVHHMREIITESGRSLWLGPDHLLFAIGRGYVPANLLRAGDEVIAAEDTPTPIYTREFVLPWLRRGNAEPVPPPTSPPIPERSGLPTRRRDWVRVNRALRGNNVYTVYDFQVKGTPNYLADGLLVRNCLLTK